MSPWGEGGRQGRKPQANSDPQAKHRGSVLPHPEHPKYKEGVAPTTAPVTPRFSKTERREILSGSQQITTANHNSKAHPSISVPSGAHVFLRSQVSGDLQGARTRGTTGWRRSLASWRWHTSQSHAALSPATVTTPKAHPPHGHSTSRLARTQHHTPPPHTRNHTPPQRAQSHITALSSRHKSQILASQMIISWL